MKIARTLLGVSLATPALYGLLAAQSAKSVSDGVYSDAQAQRGTAAYQKQCASCHGADLSGQGQTPALSGDDFKASWYGQTVDDLFEEIQTSMPADNPGALTREQTADIVAFVLKSNRFPSGAADLPVDGAALKQIQFPPAKK